MLTMFQKIKNQLMTRFYGKDRECEEWCGRICPKIRKKVNKNAEMANNYYASAAGRRIFQVTGLVGKYIVDLNKSECSCRAWQLTGIPCRHSISCARDERIKPEDLVSHCYSISAFKAAYGEIIMPCRDHREWESMNGILVKPPKYEKQVGRPSKKRKKSAVEEEEGRRMSRHGSISHCSVCNSTEHNRRTCLELGKGQV